MITLEGITVQTPIGPITLMTEMPIIPTPFGPIMIEKAKKEKAVPYVPPPPPTMGILPIVLAGLVIGGVVIYFITRKR